LFLCFNSWHEKHANCECESDHYSLYAFLGCLCVKVVIIKAKVNDNDYEGKQKCIKVMIIKENINNVKS
jgi:hypothetical protein